MRRFIPAQSAVALLSCAHSGPAPREVRIALSRDTINWLPVHLAQSLGYFREEGIGVTVSDVAGLSKGMEALVGGSVDVAGSSPMIAIQLAAKAALCSAL